MISLPFRLARRQAANIAALYGMIVAQARSTGFYRELGVPDTVEGRLDMIVLHLVLVLRALGPDSTASQQLFDQFCRDIDGNLREMGIGDLAVPKHMQRVGEAFYGRAKAYEAALDNGDDAALEAAIARNVFDSAKPELGARRLAAYMREATVRLGSINVKALDKLKLDFPDAGFAAP